MTKEIAVLLLLIAVNFMLTNILLVCIISRMKGWGKDVQSNSTKKRL